MKRGLGGVLCLVLSFSLVPVSWASANLRQSQIDVELWGDVAMYRSDPAHSGDQPGPVPASVDWVAWRGEGRGAISSAAAIVDGVLFFGAGQWLMAVNAVDGTLRWEFQAEADVRSSPAVVDGIVYFGCDDHNVYAVDAATGAEVWRVETGDRVGAAPTVSEGVVYVHSYDGFVYALEAGAGTGTERWRADVGPGSSSAAVVDGTVYVGSSTETSEGDGFVHALDAQTGTEV